MIGADPTWLRPTGLEALLEALAVPGSVVLAGGTDLVPRLKHGTATPARVVSLRGVPELGAIDVRADGVWLGAGARLQALADHAELACVHPVLRDAVGGLGAPQHRHQGTLGGNLCLDTRCDRFNRSGFWREALGGCLKAGGEVCRVAPGAERCFAVLSGDLVGPLTALGAQAAIGSAQGRRTVPLEGLYVDEGRAHLTLAPGELLLGVHLPAPPPGNGAAYRKLRRRAAVDFPLLGVAVALVVQEGRVRHVRVVLTAVVSAPLVLDGAGRGWLDRVPDSAWIAEVAAVGFEVARPMRNTVGDMGWRRRMVPVLLRRALEAALAGLR